MLARTMRCWQSTLMADTLTRSDSIPEWITQYLLDIESGRFKDGFSYLEPNAELLFGTQKVRGRHRIKQFFSLLFSPLIMKHDVSEYWDGSPVKMLRGRLLIAKRHLPADILAPPFVEFLTVSPVMTIRKIAIVVGPTQVLSGLEV